MSFKASRGRGRGECEAVFTLHLSVHVHLWPRASSSPKVSGHWSCVRTHQLLTTRWAAHENSHQCVNVRLSHNLYIVLYVLSSSSDWVWFYIYMLGSTRALSCSLHKGRGPSVGAIKSTNQPVPSGKDRRSSQLPGWPASSETSLWQASVVHKGRILFLSSPFFLLPLSLFSHFCLSPWHPCALCYYLLHFPRSAFSSSLLFSTDATKFHPVQRCNCQQQRTGS